MARIHVVIEASDILIGAGNGDRKRTLAWRWPSEREGVLYLFTVCSVFALANICCQVLRDSVWRQRRFDAQWEVVPTALTSIDFLSKTLLLKNAVNWR